MFLQRVWRRGRRQYWRCEAERRIEQRCSVARACGQSPLGPPQSRIRQERSAGSTLLTPKYGSLPRSRGTTLRADLTDAATPQRYHGVLHECKYGTSRSQCEFVRPLCACKDPFLARSVNTPACPCNSTACRARMHMHTVVRIYCFAVADTACC